MEYNITFNFKYTAKQRNINSDITCKHIRVIKNGEEYIVRDFVW